MREIKEYIIGLIFFIALVGFFWILALPVEGGTNNGMMLVDSTAYYDAYGYGHGADGRPLVEGLTIAGKKEWLGKTAILYDMDYRMIGIYEFRDTGYGQPTGKGQSQILKGRTIGTIENGTCVDVYFSSYAKCKEWGRRKVYLEVLNGKG